MAIDNRCGERKGHTGPCKPKRVHGVGIGEALEMADTAFICQKVLDEAIERPHFNPDVDHQVFRNPK